MGFGSIILKRKFKYDIRRLETAGKTTYRADVKSRTGFDIIWKTIACVSGETKEDAIRQADKYIQHYSQIIWMEDYIKDKWLDFRYFLYTLKPWSFDGWPNAVWKKARQYFKKPPMKFEVLTNYVPDLEYEDRHLKWYNFVFLKISDVDWKWKYRWIRFVDCPQVTLTFFRKWTLKWSWTIGYADSLYWEDMLEYLYHDRKPHELGQHVFKSIMNEHGIITIKDWLHNLPQKQE